VCKFCGRFDLGPVKLDLFNFLLNLSNDLSHDSPALASTPLALILNSRLGKKGPDRSVKKLTLLLTLLLLISTEAHSLSLREFKTRNWGLENQASNIEKAWGLSQGSRNVIVAVIDTGIDASHPDLKPNLWKAPGSGERSSISPVYGWDFVSKSANPVDYHGHGTHIAGIIGAIANPKTGTAGVTQSVQIMPVRYYSESAPGSVNLANTIKALHYAIDNGAKIINYSGGGPEYSEEEFQAMKKAEQHGVLIVAAAGNDHHNTDLEDYRYYPAAYQLKGLRNIITVASINSDNQILSSSNWGVKSVDVAAPGEGILSTIPGGRYGKMTGTSQATAFVSGIAALILSKAPHLLPHQIKELIIKNSTPVSGLRGKISSGGKIDAYRALAAVELSRSVNRNTASKK
jgi:subtilisin family serine protease